MPRLTLATLLLCLSTLIGCASNNELDKSIDYSPSADFTSLKSYRWYGDLHPSKEDKFRRQNASYQRRRDAIDRQLLSSGYREASSGSADFMVNYSLSKQTHTDIDSFSHYPPGGGLHGGVSTGTYGSSVAIGYSSPGSGVRTYKEGTLVIDIIDSDAGKIIWRGIADGKLPKHYDYQHSKQILHDAVQLILSEFPPETKR